ncbi:phage tail sheath family protein [Aquiflexum lacus]|uniref:phage tail sheath family protein n=1 Tax=Aquiflexum lacus TaxID=2483805 RepID=UPI001E5500BF|nr:phage tail sheath C-terminal domain-containing protein [Aquiflexum lacus]
MADYKTPGVYIREISTLPASVAPVATAIPAFVGYTRRSIRNGEIIEPLKPVRVTSMLEFLEIFGEAFSENYEIVLTGSSTDFEDTNIAVNVDSGFSPYLLNYQLRMFFDNGGGPCYIVSVGNFELEPEPSDIDVDDLLDGIYALEEEDEPTLLLVPEAVWLGTAGRRSIHDQLLAQCAKLQDRFAIMDVLTDPNRTVMQDGEAFRNEVGSSDLKYGAAYYPALKTFLSREFDEEQIFITDNRPLSNSGPFDGSTLDSLSFGENFAVGKIIITNNANMDGDAFTIGGDTFIEGTHFDRAPGDGAVAGTAEALFNAIVEANNTNYSIERDGAVLTIVATAEGEDGEDVIFSYNPNGSPGARITGDGFLALTEPDKELYNEIIKKLKSNTLNLYPSASVAGIYARVDRQRGVWKAPANVDVRGIKQPLKLVSHEEQENLNVDATSGKSINAIRAFQGKGNLVWGARTLAGNDNEWRYIPVRRLYIFIEESVKKATEFVVFEPNEANTWLRVKTMIENFLAGLWREGALAGAKTEDAFFVKIGLGQTMTALDILEGRLNIEIGLAAVRPAEFIILKFSHKLQES